MAVTQETGGVDDNHFNVGEFDGAIASHGVDALMRFAMRCACYSAETGQPDKACKSCYPFGFIYDDELSIKVHGPNRKLTRRSDFVGKFDAGDAFFTIPSGVMPPYGTRFVLPLSLRRVDDILTKGSEDIIRFAHVLTVDKAHYSRKVAVGSDFYDRVTTPLVLGTDLTITGRQVTWPGGSTVPDGTRYVVRFVTYSEWVVWEEQDRNEGGQQLPYRFLCKQLDFLLHPRGTEKLSY